MLSKRSLLIAVAALAGVLVVGIVVLTGARHGAPTHRIGAATTTSSTAPGPYTVFVRRPDPSACAAAQDTLRQLTAAHPLGTGMGADQQRFADAIGRLPVVCDEETVAAFGHQVLEPWFGPRRSP